MARHCDLCPIVIDVIKANSDPAHFVVGSYRSP